MIVKHISIPMLGMDVIQPIKNTSIHFYNVLHVIFKIKSYVRFWCTLQFDLEFQASKFFFIHIGIKYTLNSACVLPQGIPLLLL
jgi:hypothetical protein